jgi:Big-like domain-containing protein/List-Bact-rpt repeat protein
MNYLELTKSLLFNNFLYSKNFSTIFFIFILLIIPFRYAWSYNPATSIIGKPGTNGIKCIGRPYFENGNVSLRRVQSSISDNSFEARSLDKAASRWNSRSNAHISITGSTGTGGVGNGINDVYFGNRNEFPNIDILAITTRNFDFDTCKIAEIDVKFNPNVIFTSNESAQHLPYLEGSSPLPYPFLSVALHELGHVLGLDHYDRTYNIMGESHTHVNRNGDKTYYGPGADGAAGVRNLFGDNGSFDLGASIFVYGGSVPVSGEIPYSKHHIADWTGEVEGIFSAPNVLNRNREKCSLSPADVIFAFPFNIPTKNGVNCYVVNTGAIVNVPFTFENHSSLETDVIIKTYISSDNIIEADSEDVLFGQVFMTLYPGQAWSGYIKGIQIPKNLGSGENAYIGVIIERRSDILPPPGSVIDEVTYENNAAWYPFTILNGNGPPLTTSGLGLTNAPISTNLNTNIKFNLNVFDPDDDAFTYSILIQPSNGIASVTSAGIFSYRPNDGYPAVGDPEGKDKFRYRVVDEWGNRTDGEVNLIVVRPKKNVIISDIKGKGHIVSNPEGIDCRKPLSPENCIVKFAIEGTVILDAIPDSGSIFLGWSGFNQCNGSFHRCTLTIDSDQIIIAKFGIAPTSFTLTVSKIGSGSGKVTSSPFGIDCGEDCTEKYVAGANTQVTLTPSPDSGSVFTGWNGACSGTGDCTVSMFNDKKIFTSFVSSTPTIFIVSNLNDSGEGSFRQAVQNANDNLGDDIISFSNELNGTIILNTGQIMITDSVSINGLGADILAVSGNNASRIFKIIAGTIGTVAINGLTLKEGNDTTGNGGGGIFIETGSVSIERVALINNSANVDSGGGGGIRNFGPGALTISNSTVSSNSAFSIDKEGAGGGIKIDQGAERLTINNSTVSGNSAANGGGIALDEGTLVVNNSTISGNTAANGGGGVYNGGGTLIIGNSIIAGNIAPTEREIQNFAAFLSLGHNLLGQNGDAGILTTDTTLASSDLILSGSINTVISTLTDNGGSTPTHLLVADGPAIDAGDNNILIGGITTDQRGSGFFRISNDIVDIGAVEVNLNDNDGDGSPDEFDDDDDNGGATDVWEIKHGFSPLDASDDIEDPDNDGLTNVQESVLGTDPNDPDSDRDGLSDSDDPSPLTSFTLTVSKIGDGSGIVTSTVSGINCGIDCTENYPSDGNSLVTLSATAFNNAAFRGWKGACSGTDTCTVTMSNPQTVTANFVPVIPYLVSNLNDNGSGSLRQAILDANADPEESSISFSPELKGTIVLTSGELTITDSVVIVGPGADALSISGNKIGRIFKIRTDMTDEVTLFGLTLKEGRDVSGNGGGAVIITTGTTTISYSILVNNAANEGGGGAIRKFGSGTLTINNSTLSGNSAIDEFDQGDGGAIRLDDGVLTIINSTVSGNSSANGGGITVDDGALTLRNSTVFGNKAVFGGGGIFNSFSGVIILSNNLVLGNIAPTDKEVQNFGTMLSLGHNLFGENGSAGVTNATTLKSNDLILTDSPSTVIGLLADNGGSTLTHLPVDRGLAIDAGDNNLIPQGITTDQRGAGFSRISNDLVDIGAVERIVRTYTVTASANKGGKIVPDGRKSIPEGNTIDFSLTAESGFILDNVIGSCRGKLHGTTFTTEAITQDCSVKARFTLPRIAAEITSPSNASTLSGSSQVFNFEDPSNIVFSLYVGSTPGDFDLGYYPGLKGVNSVTVINLPTDGSSIYLTLYSRGRNIWLTNEYSYTASANGAAFITFPAHSATLSGSKQGINLNNLTK